MIDTEMTYPKRNKWYNNYTFPIVPQIETRPANEHNTRHFSFHWLFIKIWSLDAFQFEIAITVDNHWGAGVTMLLPYLRLSFCIPFPMRFNIWVQRNLWRKP